MKKSWRFLIACMLLVLLPLQGFAVASGFSCAMGMAAQLSALDISSNTSTNISPNAASTKSHCLAWETKAGKPVSGNAVGDAAKLSKAHDLCKASSPCCMGIALLPPAQPIIFVPVHEDASVLPVLLPASVTVSALERPPKHSFV